MLVQYQISDYLRSREGILEALRSKLEVAPSTDSFALECKLLSPGELEARSGEEDGPCLVVRTAMDCQRHGPGPRPPPRPLPRPLPRRHLI